MQIKRGLFRLWLVMSIIWAIGTVLVGYDAYQSELRSREWLRDQYEADVAKGMAIDCRIARGVWKKDYVVDDRALCLYSTPVFRRLYPEYKDRTDADLVAFLLDKAGKPGRPEPFKPWPLVGLFALVGVGVPLGFLAFGAALAWAFAGFKAKDSN